MFELKREWTQQPPAGVRLREDLRPRQLLHPPANYSYVNRSPIVRQANTAFVVTAAGVAVKGTSTTSATKIHTGNTSLDCYVGTTGPLTLVVHFKLNTAGINQCLAGSMDAAGWNGITLSLTSANILQFAWRDNTNAVWSVTVPFSDTQDWHTAVLTTAPEWGLVAYLDGRLVGTNTVTAASRKATSKIAYLGFGDYPSDFYNSDASIAFGAVFALDGRGIGRSVSANPWQLFEPHVLRVPTAAASGAYTLNAETGAYTISGSPATLAASRKLSADAGSYAVTGSAATLAANRKLSADAGSYATTGAAASLLVSRKLNAASGAYSITGIDATLVYTSNPTGYTLNAESGTYTIAGSAATLSVARLLNAAPGAYGISGVDASLVVTRNATYSLNAASGAYTITGAAATLQRSRAIDAQPGAYNVNGVAATLYWSGQIQPATQTRAASPQLNAGQPAVYPHDGTMQQHFRQWANIVTQYLPIVGNGSPEGVVAAPMYSLYIDSTGTTGSIEYRKMLPDIAGDRKMGWVKT